MKLFKSKQERRLWLCVVLVQAAIYGTLALAGKLAGTILAMDREVLSGAFFVVFVGLIAVSIWAGWRPGRREIGVFVGIVACYAMVPVRLGMSPVERTHLFEYGVVAVLVYHALMERVAQGCMVPLPTVMAVAITTILGLIDEMIQISIPNRFYDPRDVLFNSLAAAMAVAACRALVWARQWKRR